MNYQDIFIAEVTKNDKIHLEDFLAKVRSNLKEFEANEQLNSKHFMSLEEMDQTNFYKQCQAFL